MTEALWCEWALLDDDVAGGVMLETSGDTITAVRPGTPRPERDATILDGLTLPGFANTHSHVFHRALRGRAQEGEGSFWSWREAMYTVADRIDPTMLRRLAVAVFAEMAEAGYTVVGEFHYLHNAVGGQPYDDPNAMGAAVAEAAAEVGIRLTLLDVCYLQGGFGGDGHLPPTGTQSRFDDGSVERWVHRTADLRDGDGLRIGAAIHSVRAVAPAAMRALAKVAGERGSPVHMHVSEQPAEVRDCEEAYGLTPVRLLAENGILDDRFTAVHATHVDEEEMAILGGHGSGVCLCPTTERDLADGIGPSVSMAANAVPLSLGSDSHAVIDPFEEMRAVELNQRLVSLHRGSHQPADLLRMGSATGYRALGWPGGGIIAEGAIADLVSVGFDSVRLAGTAQDHLRGTVVFSATGADVRTVVVGGDVIVDGGRHVAIDTVTELYGTIDTLWR